MSNVKFVDIRCKYLTKRPL